MQPFTEEEIQQRLRFAENQDNEETVDGNREDSQEETDGDLISNSNSRDTKSSFKNENKVLKNWNITNILFLGPLIYKFLFVPFFYQIWFVFSIWIWFISGALRDFSSSEEVR